MLERALPSGARSRQPGAALPDRAGNSLLPNPRPRHQARPAPATRDPHDRGRGACRQGGLLAPPHRALRARRDLHVQLGRRERRRRPWRGGPDRSRHLRGHRRLGDGSRRPVPGLRRVVAPERRRRDHLRVGDPIDDRERPESRGSPGQAVRPSPRLLEPVGGPAHPADRPGRRAPDGARAEASARSAQGLGVRRGGAQRRRSLGVGLAVAPRRRAMDSEEGDHDSGRAG